MESPSTPSPRSHLTLLDLTLIGTLSIVAFSVGNEFSDAISTRWRSTPPTRTAFENANKLPASRDRLATVERRQDEVRARIASAHTSDIERAASPSEASTEADYPDTDQLLDALESEAANLATLQGEARLALERAERQTTRQEHNAIRLESWRQLAALSIISFPALGILLVILRGVAAAASTPLATRDVAQLSVLVLAALLVADTLGWLAAVAVAVVIVTVVVGERSN